MCQAPDIICRSLIDVSLNAMRGRIRLEFERHRNALNSHDLDAINIAIFKGTCELIEAHNVWKQTPHVMRYFDASPFTELRHTTQKSFLTQFFENANAK